MLPPVLGPLDGAAHAAARDGDQIVLGVELAPHAEAAADIKLDQLDRSLGQPEGPDQRLLVEVGDLGGTPQSQALPVGEIGDEPPGFERQGGLAMGPEPFFPAIGRGGEGGLGVAAADGVADRHVVAGVLVDESFGLRRGLRIGHRRQRVVVDLDRRERVLRGVAVGRDDDGDGLAGETRLGSGDGLLQKAVEARESGEPERDLRQRAVEVGAAERIDRPGRGTRRAKVNRADARMGEGASEDRHMRGAGRGEIVDETAGSAQEPPVLAPPQRAPDHPLLHTTRRFCIFAARR